MNHGSSIEVEYYFSRVFDYDQSIYKAPRVKFEALNAGSFWTDPHHRWDDSDAIISNKNSNTMMVETSGLAKSQNVL